MRERMRPVSLLPVVHSLARKAQFGAAICQWRQIGIKAIGRAYYQHIAAFSGFKAWRNIANARQRPLQQVGYRPQRVARSIAVLRCRPCKRQKAQAAKYGPCNNFTSAYRHQ